MLVRDAESGQALREHAGAKVQTPFVTGSAVDVDQRHRAQRVRMRVEQYQRIVGEPALPYVVSKGTGLKIARQIEPERLGRWIGRIRRRHAEHVEHEEVVVLLLDLRLERREPRRDPTRALERRARGRDVAAIAVVEVQVAAVAGESSKHRRMPHAEPQRAVAARRLAGDTAMRAGRLRAVARVDVRDEF